MLSHTDSAASSIDIHLSKAYRLAIMATTNDITNDRLISRVNSKEYTDNFDAIFRQPINLNTYPKHETLCHLCGDVECDCAK